MLAVSWVLFGGASQARGGAAARRLACDRSDGFGVNFGVPGKRRMVAGPAIRNWDADSALFDGPFLIAVKAVLKSDPEALFGEMKDGFASPSISPW